EVAGDALVIMDAPAVLLAAGAAAFGTYETGEPFDAVSAMIPLDPECAVAAPAPEETMSATEGEQAVSSSAVPWWAWVLGALLLLAIIAAVAVVVVVRRRAA